MHNSCPCGIFWFTVHSYWMAICLLFTVGLKDYEFSGSIGAQFNWNKKMFAFGGSSKEVIENSVHSTGVPLSERWCGYNIDYHQVKQYIMLIVTPNYNKLYLCLLRFKHVPSHNPLRPSQEVKRIVRGFKTDARIPRSPIHRERFPGIETGVNVIKIQLWMHPLFMYDV